MRAQDEVRWLAAIIESSDDAIVGQHLDGSISSWNAGAERMFGYAAHEMVGGSMRRLIPAHLADSEAELIASVAGGGTVPPFETERLTRDGRTIMVSVRISPIRSDTGALVGIARSARDVTEVRARERELARLSRLYSALSHVNQLIVKIADRDRLFHSVCQTLVESGGFDMAWVGWHDAAARRLRPVGQFGQHAAEFLAAVPVYTESPTDLLGPAGTAWHTGKPCILTDIEYGGATEAQRAAFALRGWRAASAFPIRLNGAIVGTLSVYDQNRGVFQDAEVELLSEVAGDLSFALENASREEARKRADALVAQERDFSSAVLDSMPGVLYLYDRHGRFLRWNKNFEQATGYSAAEIASMHPLQFFRGDEQTLVGDRIAEVFRVGSSSVEAELVAKDGSVTPYLFTGVVVTLAGEPCLVGVGVDISARRASEAARAISEGRYRALFEQAPDGILLADAEGRYLDANPAICRMLGRTREAMIGLSAGDIIAPNELSQVAPALDEITVGSMHQREWMFRRADGTEFPADVTATMMPDGELLAIVRDVTERRQIEQAIRSLNETLERRVTVRTAELRTALVRAEAADRLKSAFLATMSHELRTPLNSIIGFTGTVLQGMAGPLNAEQSKQLGMVRGSARHLLELINDVLDLSKIEAGQLKVRSERFDLRALLERVVATVSPMAAQQGLALTSQIAPDIGEMQSDRRRVEQILLNLLQNAIKFSSQGGVTLTAIVLPAPPGADLMAAQVQLTVTDTGIGISPADIATLFQPFRQLDTGLSRQHEGTGLGLAICRRLAVLLGGEITVVSEVRQGSAFTVTLPLQVPDVSREDA